MGSATCRSCGAPITWAATATGKRMPVDRDPHPDGNVVLRPRERGEGLLATVIGAADRASVGRAHQLHRPHFATCPQASEHRRSP